MIEVWVTASLSDDQYARLCDVARERYPEIINEAWPDSMQVSNLLRDLMADALRPLLGEGRDLDRAIRAGAVQD